MHCRHRNDPDLRVNQQKHSTIGPANDFFRGFHERHVNVLFRELAIQGEKVYINTMCFAPIVH